MIGFPIPPEPCTQHNNILCKIMTTMMMIIIGKLMRNNHNVIVSPRDLKHPRNLIMTLRAEVKFQFGFFLCYNNSVWFVFDIIKYLNRFVWYFWIKKFIEYYFDLFNMKILYKIYLIFLWFHVSLNDIRKWMYYIGVWRTINLYMNWIYDTII